MLIAKALFIASDAREWLVQTHQARVLNVFASVCNLINEPGEILSIVTPRIPIGPFTLRLNEEVTGLSHHIDRESAIAIEPGRLRIGNIQVDLCDAKIWSPTIDWEPYHTSRAVILNSIGDLVTWSQYRAPDGSLLEMIQHMQLAGSFLGARPSGSFDSSFLEAAVVPARDLCMAIISADLAACLEASRRLAGLGPGLTPSGDDFLLGAIYAAWIVHPASRARTIAEGIAAIAASLTTPLSAAYLRSGAQGKAGILWQGLLAALASNELSAAKSAADSLLSIGNTSGADTLAGFLAALSCFEVSRTSQCPS